MSLYTCIKQKAENGPNMSEGVLNFSSKNKSSEDRYMSSLIKVQQFLPK